MACFDHVAFIRPSPKMLLLARSLSLHLCRWDVCVCVIFDGSRISKLFPDISATRFFPAQQTDGVGDRFPCWGEKGGRVAAGD